MKKTFDLPVGALVGTAVKDTSLVTTESGEHVFHRLNTLIHLGNGRFAIHHDDDNPRLIEVIQPAGTPSTDEKIRITEEPVPLLDGDMQRAIYFVE